VTLPNWPFQDQGAAQARRTVTARARPAGGLRPASAGAAVRTRQPIHERYAGRSVCVRVPKLTKRFVDANEQIVLIHVIKI
jgi:hypothetical protein